MYGSIEVKNQKKYQNSQSEFYIVRFTSLIRDEIFCDRGVHKKREQMVHKGAKYKVAVQNCKSL